MSDEFFKSVDAIRVESFDMLKSLRAIKGENYARLVHAIILTEQIVGIGETFAKGASESSKPAADLLRNTQEKMATLVMEYFVRSTGFSDQQVKEAFTDAERVVNTTMGLVERAAELAQDGKVMGGGNAH